MNELARLVPFLIEDMQYCRIVDKNGDPWFVAKEMGILLEIKNYRDAVNSFPKNEKGVVSIDTLGGPQKMLIINSDGLFRLIQKSRKPEAWKIKERFIKILSEISKKGINRAALPQIYTYRGKELTWGEWVNKREESREKWLNGDIFGVVKNFAIKDTGEKV